MNETTHLSDFDTLVFDTFTKINDEVFCYILDLGLNPGDAYRMAYIDVPTETDFINPDFEPIPESLMDEHDCVLLEHQ
jgi:hypothetical protein